VPGREWGAREGVGCKLGIEVPGEGVGCQGGSGVPGREWGAREGVGCKLGIKVPGRSGVQA